MKAIPDFDKVEETGNSLPAPPPGGYVCIITGVEDNPEKEYLSIVYDILEGEYKGYNTKFEERNGFPALRCIRSYKEKARGAFKGFIRTVTESGDGRLKWDWNEKRLIGQMCGFVVGEEEYRRSDGSIGVRLNTTWDNKTVQDIREGRFKVPPKKMLPVEEAPPPAWVSEAQNAPDDLPDDL